MGARFLKRTKGLYITVTPYIIMITRAGKSPAQVVCYQVVFRIATVEACGGTMDNDKIDKSHNNAE